MHTQVEYQENGGYPLLLFFSEKNAEGALVGDSHLIPLQAVADRMELYGLESVEQTLEYIGREFYEPDVSDTLHEPIQTAYKRVAQAEADQLISAVGKGARPAVEENRFRQTLMRPFSVESDARAELSDVRDWAMRELAMRSQIHTFGAARMLDDSRPIERTTPAASTSLRADESVIRSAVTLVQEKAPLLEAWRVQTLVSHAPLVAEYIAQQSKADDAGNV